MNWRQIDFQSHVKFVVLEIIMPRENIRSPRAMEQIFLAMHGLGNAPGDPNEKYIEGEVPRRISLEIVSFGGETHFYVRMYHKRRNLVEAAFFSHYPDIELVEVDDYAQNLPKTVQEIYTQGKDMWGTEMLLVKEPAYPIKSYRDFTEEQEEERNIDPLAACLETMSTLKEGELLAIQIVITPDEWSEDDQNVIEELKAKTGEKKTLISEEGTESTISMRTPGETDTIRDMEKNLSKPPFKTIIRHIYFSEFEGFYDSFARRGMRAYFNQYSSLGLNGFKDNNAVSTRTRVWYWPYLFPKVRSAMRKQRLLSDYIGRTRPSTSIVETLISSHIMNWNNHSKSIMLNTEGLATLFHPPTVVVLTAPHIKRTESKRASPPAGMPIYAGEEEIDKYQ